MSVCREFKFSEMDFYLLQQLVLRHTGISLSERKQDLVYGRLSRRLRVLHMDDFHEYCNLIDDGHEDELEHFVNAITTNLTSFFRENHHFEHLKNIIIPELIKSKAHSRRLRIWSAGCSSGEEPYSIAIALREAIPHIDSWDVKILATDLDSNVIANAVKAIYPMDRVADLAESRLKKWFQKGTGQHKDMVRVVPSVRKLISFRHLNLINEWPMKGPIDMIFCRNVVIYFDKHTQIKLFERYANIMSPGGHLFIGHSESLRQVTERFELLGNTIYKKID